MCDLTIFLEKNNLASPDSVEKIRLGIHCMKRQCCEFKPKKPILPTNPTPANYGEHSEGLANYEVRWELWIQTETENTLHNTHLDAIILDYIREESGFNALKVSNAQKHKIFALAWSDGHGGGYCGVYQQLCKLVDLFVE